MTKLPDYYAILDVSPTASRDEIRAAYRRLARRHHPDVNPRCEDDVPANESMRRFNEAYEVLNNPRQRAAYDRQRWAQAPPSRRPSPYRPTPSGPPLSYDGGWGTQAGGGRWRQPRASRAVYDQPMPGWLEDALAVAEHLKRRLEPIWTLIGVVVPVLVAMVLLIVGFWTYEEIRADPDAVGFINCIVGAIGGVGVLFGVLGVIFLFFLVAWFAVWQAFHQ